LKFLPSRNNVDEQTKFQFLEVCKNFQLNPFKKEIYLILRRQKDKTENYVDVFNIVVGYEAYRRRAEKMDDMDGGITVDTALDEQTALPVKSTATLYRKGKTHAYTKTVYFNEFAQKTMDGRLMSLWATKPIFLLEKVAEATLLRMAYPCEFEAMPYIAEEMPLSEEVVSVKEIKEENDFEFEKVGYWQNPDDKAQVFAGTADLVVKKGNKVLAIIDFKTSKPQDWHAMQVPEYTMIFGSEETDLYDLYISGSCVKSVRAQKKDFFSEYLRWRSPADLTVLPDDETKINLISQKFENILKLKKELEKVSKSLSIGIYILQLSNPRILLGLTQKSSKKITTMCMGNMFPILKFARVLE
jgi:phage recombination protein Bet